MRYFRVVLLLIAGAAAGRSSMSLDNWLTIATIATTIGGFLVMWYFRWREFKLKEREMALKEREHDSET